MNKQISFVLRYPVGISVNHCYGRNGAKTYLNPSVKRYREGVWLTVKDFQSFNDDPVRLEINMFPPDLRRRDADNICKVVLDAIKHANLINDDSQILELYVKKHRADKNARLEITLISLST